MSSIATPALEAQGLNVWLGKRHVLRDVAFRTAPRTLSAIVGPNGAGKSTLLRSFAGLLPYRGSARCEGAEISSWTAPERACRIAYVPQRSRLTARLTVREVVLQGRFARRPGFFAAPKADDDRAQLALQRAGIATLSDRPYPDLSGGEQRLVLLARALASGARTLLLDEPTASLDVKHQLSLFELLRNLTSDGFTITCVLHDLDDALRHADHTLLLDRGQLSAEGHLRDTPFREAVEAAFEVRLRQRSRLGFEPREA